MSQVSIAGIQLAQNTAVQSVADRVEHALKLTRAACAEADMVILPELWLAGAFDIHTSGSLAEPLDGPLVNAFSAVATETNTWLHMGSFPERYNGNNYNTSVLFDPSGEIAATYRKIHLFGFDGGEPAVMTAGEELVVVDTPLGPTGLATCYDLRFPEQFRALVDAGAQTFLITSGWPTRRIDQWRILLQARAIEDLAWVVAVNGVGTQNGTELGGYSAVIDPRGAIVAETSTGEEILRARIDPTEALQWRGTFPALTDRVDIS